MKNILILFLSVLYLFKLNAQADSIPVGRVLYMQQADAPGDLYKNGYATLLFNNARSLYIHNGAPVQDSSYYDQNYIIPVSITGDKEGFPIYKMHSERKMLCKISCRQALEHCIVSDTFGTISWNPHPEHKQFGLYDCRRATGKFRGREYEAWYASDIPIPSGPFKLGGLPGLILEASSKDGKVKFLFAGLELSKNITGNIARPSGKYMNMKQSEYEKNEEEFCLNLIKDAQAKGLEISVTRMETIEIWPGQ